METELLPVIGRRPRWRPSLVPVLCGTVLAASWCGVCLAMVPWIAA